jgi:hypothetical protein
MSECGLSIPCQDRDRASTVSRQSGSLSLKQFKGDLTMGLDFRDSAGPQTAAASNVANLQVPGTKLDA